MKISKIGFALTLSLSFVSFACGDDATTTGDLSSKVDMAAGGGDMTQVMDLAQNGDMAGFQLVEGCQLNGYTDATSNAALRTISPWDTTLGRKCLRIKAGQTVTWSPTPSSTHPLNATGGTTPSPITNTAMVTFPTVGVYGFHCGNHPTLMQGAIWVEP